LAAWWPRRPRPAPGSDTTPVRRRRLRRALVAAVVVLALFVGATLGVLVFPPTDRPSRADAIFMLDGEGDRIDEALALARAGYAPVLAVSQSSPWRICPKPSEVPGVRVICFRPNPDTTQGEAREAELLARRYGWKKVIFVVERSQDVRARLRISRCYHGQTLVVAVDPPMGQWPGLIAYQWAAMVKALVLQPTC
jgi:hypothetical protein